MKRSPEKKAGSASPQRAVSRGWTRRISATGVTPEINVTPLVDVVLVLLIICMVVAPRMDQDVPVDLPGIFNPDPEVETAMDPVKLSVATAGEYYIAEQKYDLEGAIAALAAEHASEPLRRLVLRADSKLTYGQVREILARSQQVGFPGMSLMVGERHQNKATADGETVAGAAGAAEALPPPAEGG